MGKEEGKAVMAEGKIILAILAPFVSKNVVTIVISLVVAMLFMQLHVVVVVYSLCRGGLDCIIRVVSYTRILYV